MLATLALLAQVVAAPIHAATADRPVRLWLGPSPVVTGAAIPVYVAAAQDGYLLVLRVATDGRVVVVFPADPKSDGFVARGAYSLRARGGQPALVVNEGRGTGLVLAALSPTPFRSGEFTRAGRWDSGLLAASYPGADGPGTLTDIAQRMLGDGWFNSDFALYTVRSEGDAQRIAAQRIAAERAAAERAAALHEPRGQQVEVIVYQTASPAPVLEQTAVERTLLEPVMLIATVCEPGAGGCHPSGFHRRRHDRRDPAVKTSGVCQMGIDCPPGVGLPARAHTLGLSPIPRPRPVAPTPPREPATPVAAPAPLERVVTRSKPTQYVVMSAPARAPAPAPAPAAQALRRTGSSDNGNAAGTGTVTQERTLALPRAGGRAARIQRRR